MDKYYEIDFLFDELYFCRASVNQTKALVQSILEDPEVYEYCKFSNDLNDELYNYIFVKSHLSPEKNKEK